MDRSEFLLHGIRKDMLGIEIGPYFAPLVPKAEGFRSLSLDMMDRDGLRERARGDRNISPDVVDRIEEVDLVGQASDLAALADHKGLLGKCDYVLSSHNIEHFPDPILFLKNCEKVLHPTGFVSMAIPDRRGCFDFFRSLSRTADLLEAFHAERLCPTYSQLFDFNSLLSHRHETASSWTVEDDSDAVAPVFDLRQTFADAETWRSNGSKDPRDIHCFVYIKPSFELIIRELHYLGVIDLGIETMGGPAGCEFWVRLRNGLPRPPHDEFVALRGELLQRVNDDNASNSRAALSLTRRNEELLAKQEALLAKQEALEKRIDQMQRSIGWRLTRPLRRLFDRPER